MQSDTAVTLILDLNPAQQHALQTSAAREGVAVDEYALRQLFPATLPMTEKPFRASEFAGIAPTGRTAEEIDAEIRAMRDEGGNSAVPSIVSSNAEWAKTAARFAAIDTRQKDRAFESACSETLRYYQETISNDARWLTPNVARFGEDEIILEWWQDERKLTIYFAPDGAADYFASWGADISNSMDEGDAREPGKFASLWNWLHNK